MSKDSYWFRHDSTAGRGLRMRKMAHLYGHWGKGVYWDVIEILRDQTNYCFDCDPTSLQMLCDLIGCKDEPRFLMWFNDCVKLELFLVDNKKFFSEVLCKNMQNWEKYRDNGKNGGRPITKHITKHITKEEPNRNQTHIHKIGEDRIGENRIDNTLVAPVPRTVTRPTLEEVKAYCLERKNQVDPQRWIDHYTSNGWRVGKNPMKDWRAAIRTWERSGFTQQATTLQKPVRVDKATPPLYVAPVKL